MANKPQKELGGPRKMSKGMKILVAVFAVVMAVSMMLPSLAQIFAGGQSSSSEESSEQASSSSAEAEDTQGSDESSSSEGSDAKQEEEDVTANVPENDTLKSLAEQNKDTVSKFAKRLGDDPNDLAALLNLAQTYMNWGGSATYSSSTDEEKAYSKELLTKAMDYFDRYIKLHDSVAARVQRIMCESYADDTATAVKDMEKLSEEKPDSPVVWMYLGVLYSQSGDNDKAVAAYEKIAQVDPDDEYGLQSYAKSSIESIKYGSSSFEDLTNQKLLGTNSQPTEGLPGVIAKNNDASSQNTSGVQTIM